MDVAEEETAEVEWEEEEEDWEGETEEEQEEEPEEEQEEEHEEDYQTKGICSFISEDVSQLLFIQLLFSDGWRRRRLRMVTWKGTFVWNKKMSMKQSVHPQLNAYQRQQGLFIYLIFTYVFWWIVLISGFVFRLKKGDTEGNSEDDSKGDPEENTACVQHWRGTKR